MNMEAMEYRDQPSENQTPSPLLHVGAMLDALYRCNCSDPTIDTTVPKVVRRSILKSGTNLSPSNIALTQRKSSPNSILATSSSAEPVQSSSSGSSSSSSSSSSSNNNAEGECSSFDAGDKEMNGVVETRHDVMSFQYFTEVDDQVRTEAPVVRISVSSTQDAAEEAQTTQDSKTSESLADTYLPDQKEDSHRSEDDDLENDHLEALNNIRSEFDIAEDEHGGKEDGEADRSRQSPSSFLDDILGPVQKNSFQSKPPIKEENETKNETCDNSRSSPSSFLESLMGSLGSKCSSDADDNPPKVVLPPALAPADPSTLQHSRIVHQKNSELSALNKEERELMKSILQEKYPSSLDMAPEEPLETKPRRLSRASSTEMKEKALFADIYLKQREEAANNETDTDQSDLDSLFDDSFTTDEEGSDLETDFEIDDASFISRFEGELRDVEHIYRNLLGFTTLYNTNKDGEYFTDDSATDSDGSSGTELFSALSNESQRTETSDDGSEGDLFYLFTTNKVKTLLDENRIAKASDARYFSGINLNNSEDSIENPNSKFFDHRDENKSIFNRSSRNSRKKKSKMKADNSSTSSATNGAGVTARNDSSKSKRGMLHRHNDIIGAGRPSQEQKKTSTKKPWHHRITSRRIRTKSAGRSQGKMMNFVKKLEEKELHELKGTVKNFEHREREHLKKISQNHEDLRSKPNQQKNMDKRRREHLKRLTVVLARFQASHAKKDAQDRRSHLERESLN